MLHRDSIHSEIKLSHDVSMGGKPSSPGMPSSLANPDVQILRVGKFNHPKYGEFEITQQSLMKEKHLRLMVRPLGNGTPSKPLTAVWFNRTQSLPATAKLAYRLVTDRYQGQARVQLMIEAHDEAPTP